MVDSTDDRIGPDGGLAVAEAVAQRDRDCDNAEPRFGGSAKLSTRDVQIGAIAGSLELDGLFSMQHSVVVNVNPLDKYETLFDGSHQLKVFSKGRKEGPRKVQAKAERKKKRKAQQKARRITRNNQ